MSKKILNFLIIIYLLFTLFIFINNPQTTKSTITEILNLWLYKVLLSLTPMYLLSNLLINYPFISKLLYPVLNKILNFESEKSCSLFLLSIITGNPTSSILVINAYTNNDLSLEETNRLLKCTALSSPLFILSMFGKIGYIILIINILVNCILYYQSKVIKTYKKIITKPINFIKIIDTYPKVMIDILCTMIFVSLLKLPIYYLIDYLNINNLLINIFLDFFELTTGLNNIFNYNISYYIKLIISTFILSIGGLTILIQVLNEIKKTSLSKTSLIISRIKHALLSTTLLIIYMIFFV